MQNKSMAMAEQSYEKDKQFDEKKSAPKFELKNVGLSDLYNSYSFTTTIQGKSTSRCTLIIAFRPFSHELRMTRFFL